MDNEEYSSDKIARSRRRRNRARRKREQEVRLQKMTLAGALALCLVLLILVAGVRRKAAEREREREAEIQMQEELEQEEELLSDSVLQYEDTVKYYAEEAGIGGHVPVLLAIMEVETKGERDDVMQSSESLGLEPDSLSPEESIAQACSYYSGLVDRAEELGCDRDSVIQAYNYGPGYLNFVAENGGEHSFDLAVEYAEEMSGGRTANYTHYIADDNGNWMYLYGNMYYVKLVKQYLP